MNRREKLARHLAVTHHTTDPQQIIEALQIPYYEQPLPLRVQGLTFRNEDDQRLVITVNSYLEGDALTYARAHELGHYLLHDHTGHYLIAESTLIPPGRYEREADEFARALLNGNTP